MPPSTTSIRVMFERALGHPQGACPLQRQPRQTVIIVGHRRNSPNRGQIKEGGKKKKTSGVGSSCGNAYEYRR